MLFLFEAMLFLLIILDTSVGRIDMTNLHNSLSPPCSCRPSTGVNLTDENVFKTEISKSLFICIVETLEVKDFFIKYPLPAMNMNVVFTQEEDTMQYMTSNRNMIDHHMRNCSTVIKLLSSNSNSSATEDFSGPGICIPIPYVEIPVGWLLPPYDKNRAISLTLTIGAISVLHQLDNNLSTVENTTKRNASIANGIGIILKSLARRRVEECIEKANWPLGSFNNISTLEKDIHSYKHTNWTNSSYLLPYESKFEKRRVYGLIIWIGTNVRSHLLYSQLKVLQLQNHTLQASQKVYGWAATEDSYSCRIANDSRVCGHSYGYHWMLPSTQLASRALTGWGCGQRRPLRYVYDLSYILKIIQIKVVF